MPVAQNSLENHDTLACLSSSIKCKGVKEGHLDKQKKEINKKLYRGFLLGFYGCYDPWKIKQAVNMDWIFH